MNDFYVYTLAYPDDTVFYVGKGKVRSRGRFKNKERIDTHESEARRGCHCSKCEVIRSIWATGRQFKKAKVYETDSEQDALLFEWAGINLLYASPALANEYGNLYYYERKRATRNVQVTKYLDQAIQELTRRQVLDYLGVASSTLDGYVKRGRINRYRRTVPQRVVYRRSEVEALAEPKPKP